MEDGKIRVRKRDGSVADFDISKIKAAMGKAFAELGKPISGDAMDLMALRALSVADDKVKDGVLGVEDIQNAVEITLIQSGFVDVAKAFMEYRQKRAEARTAAKATELDYAKLVNDYLGQNDWRVKENSTVTYTLGGLILSNSGAVTANYWLSQVYDKEIADAHRNADIHIHDLSMLSPYCFTGDTRIKTLDGKHRSFKELVDSGTTKVWVFSYDLEKNEIVPALAENPRVTRKCSELIRITLSSKKSILCTPDHPFLVRNGHYVRADMLKAGDALMGFAKRRSKGHDGHSVLLTEKIRLGKQIDVYDITVPKYSNFALDSGIFVHNCAGWSLKQLIKEGLGGVQGKISSTPASHLSTLCNQMVNFMGVMQNEWAGAQAFSSFDTYLAPFVKVDNLSYKEVKQAVQSFVFGVNTPSRWGSQSPFTNITLDWKVPNDLRNLKAIVGGKEMDFTYGDCQKEMDMVNKAFLEIFLEGDANGRGFQYPIPTYSITKDFDWSDTENNRLLFDLTAKYGTPYFSNYINSSMKPEDIRSMCPLTGDTMVLVKNASGRIFSKSIISLYKNSGRSYQYWNGKVWVEGHPIKVDATDYRVIILENGASVKMGINHLQPVKGRGTVKASELIVGDQLPFSKPSFAEVPSYASSSAYCESDSEYDYFRIKSIRNMKATKNTELFCIEINEDSHLFALANGLVTHNCRLRLDLRELRKRDGGFFGSGDSTGSVGVVTINMPRLGYLASDKEDFYKRLDHMMDICARSLEMKRKVIADLYNKGLYPYSKRYLGDIGYHNHFSTIGLVGMNEACLNAKWLKCDLTHKEAQDFTEEVLNHMRNRLSDYQEQYPGTLFNLEATPAESTCVSGDTLVWTDKGQMKVVDILKAFGDKQNVGIVSRSDESGKIEIKRLADCWMTKRNASILRIAFSDGDCVKVTPNHRFAKMLSDKSIEYVEASTLRIGDRIAAKDNEFLSVSDISALKEKEDVYDLEVEDNHNFFISGGSDDAVLVHNCYRLAKHDKETYPDIITAGKPGETPYYTNSSHLPVGYTSDIFSALDVEDRFQTLYTSGTVFHAFLGQKLPNWQSCMKLVRKIAENYKLPYYTMSPTYSICPEHGYLDGEQWKCPICGKETEVYSRITGYYRPVKNWNAGKAQEFSDRKTYVVGDAGQSAKAEAKPAGCNGSCEFGNSEFSQAAPTKVDHIMVFTSPTCPNCKMAKMLLDKAGIKYENIDAVSNAELTKSFGITKAPTMLVPDGESFDVYDNASQIAGWIKTQEAKPING